MLSNTAKYATRAVIYLSVYASEKHKIGIKEVSEKLEIPTPFLAKILQTLARHNILNSTKGPRGGFYLARKAEEIMLMEIIEIIDGNDIFDVCLIRADHCSDDSPCGLHDSITAVRKEMKSVFMNKSIADLAGEFKQDSERVRI